MGTAAEDGKKIDMSTFIISVDYFLDKLVFSAYVYQVVPLEQYQSATSYIKV